MKWCAIAALNILKKEDGPHLLLCDNLDSQTAPEFKAYLLYTSWSTVTAMCIISYLVIQTRFK